MQHEVTRSGYEIACYATQNPSTGKSLSACNEDKTFTVQRIICRLRGEEH